MKNNDAMKLTVLYKLYSKMAVVAVKNEHAIFFRILWLSETIEMLKSYKTEIVVKVV